MGREGYKIFSAGKIGKLALKNRLVRSATWDPCILGSRTMTEEVLALYRVLALGGVGLIITGGLPVFDNALLEAAASEENPCAREETEKPFDIAGLDRLVAVVHNAAPDCKLIAQLEVGYVEAVPSPVPSPFFEGTLRSLDTKEICAVVRCFVEAIVEMKAQGFDGVQLHAAHGGFLSCFLSPYTNRRDDAYGGSVENRVKIVRDIVTEARKHVGDFPILIKVNGTDYVPGGVDLDTFPELASAIARAGVDAIEVSGGMWDCLIRSEEALGFRPVPSPEAHTQLHSPDKQSYFLPYAQQLDLDIPIILVGGNRDVERLEAILQRGKVDFIALCRPLISEPALPNRWRRGQGSAGTDCISCNACIYAMIVHPGKPEPELVSCVFKRSKETPKTSTKKKPTHQMAQAWLASWVEENRISHTEE